MKFYKYLSIGVLMLLTFASLTHAQSTSLLTKEESFWLASRNNTIVVYLEQNNPPYSYQNAAGSLQGLAVDYIELISKKIGARIEYLAPRSRIQVLEDMKTGKGDIATLTPDAEREGYLRFTASYISVPGVLVVRKDAQQSSGLTPNDYNGKRLAVVNGSALESYIRTNYPRVVIEEVTDDEVALQQVVLGEVDAAAMDVASLSYYISKQVLSSVKIVGNTGFDYNPAFAVQKDKQILQGMLEKGLSQITTNERALLTEKWIAVPGDQQEAPSWIERIYRRVGVGVLIVLSIAGIVGIVLFFTRHRHVPFRYMRKRRAIDSLKDEMVELEYANKELVEELEGIKTMEHDIQEKIKEIQ